MFHKAVFHAELENVDGIVGVILDITERKQAEKMYQQMALTDALTGLDNRLSMMSHLEHSLAITRRAGTSTALLLLDLDDFKDVNDNYGHPVGDALLKEVACRLKSVVRASDLVARLGGDEFAITLEQVADVSQSIHVAEKVIAQVAQPLQLEGVHVNIGVSIGIAFAPEHADSVEALMKYADISLYRAKGQGKNCYSIYQP